MQLPTIVDSYVRAALKHAVVEDQDDGSVVATVPEAFGVVAFGANQLECGADLYARLEDWVCVSRSSGFTLPAIDGVDPNCTDGQAPVVSHEGHPNEATGEIFANEQDFMAALDRLGTYTE